MKLYASPFACSLAAHIALRERGRTFEIEWVDLRSKATRSGSDLRAVNPKGKLATLVLDDGSVITENIAVLAYLGQGEAPGGTGPLAQIRLLEWLAFVSTELHKQILTPAFDPAAPAPTRAYVLEAHAPAVLAEVERHLTETERDYLLGDVPSVADAYLFWATLLLRRELGVDFEPLDRVRAFAKRMSQRPGVREAVAIEREALAEARRR